MRAETLKADGLNDEEIRLLTKPMCDLTVAELPYAVAAKDRHGDLIRKMNENFTPTYKGVHLISDCLDRLLNPATGKYYDSKSRYYSDLKATGHMVVEPGMFPEKREVRGDFNCFKELKAAYQEVMARH